MTAIERAAELLRAEGWMVLPPAWQTIDTAPRESQILARRWGEDYRIVQGEYFKPPGEKLHAVIDRVTGRWWYCTHWQPMPAPPAEDTAP